MATASPERLTLAGKLANTKRHYPNQDTTEIERELAAVKIADYIRSIVAEAPPLRRISASASPTCFEVARTDDRKEKASLRWRTERGPEDQLARGL